MDTRHKGDNNGDDNDNDDDDDNSNKKKKKKRRRYIDVAIPADRNVVQKEAEKKLKYTSLCIEI
jgi:hypothetical protein